MKYCTNCGKENSKRMCINCGAKQNSIHKFCGWCGIELNQNALCVLIAMNALRRVLL